MAKKLSDDNPCKGCGARRSDRCICKATPKQVAAMAAKRIKDRERYAKAKTAGEMFGERLCRAKHCRLNGMVHAGKHEREIKLSDVRISATAEHCNRNLECMLLAGHSRPECFTYADDAELARFRATEMNHPEREGWNDGNCNHQAHVICLRPKGHDGQHAGNPIGKQPRLMGWLPNIGKVYS